MTTYRERLTAPASWWIAALAFSAAWGWIMLVATNWPIAITATLIVAGPCLFSGVALRLAAHHRRRRDPPGGARVDRSRPPLGAVEPLHRADYRLKLGTGADARGYLVTRPYVDRGVLVPITDDSDPTPYWLVSSRRPDALAVALGHTENAQASPAHDPNGDAPSGEEEG